MTMSRENLAKRRKYLPLVILYPLSAGIAVVSTSYIATTINKPTKSAPVSNSSSVQVLPTTTSATTTTISAAKLQEQVQLAQLNNKIAELKGQLSQLTSGVTTSQGSSPSAVGAQMPAPTLSTHSTPPPVVKTAPPVTHATTGASSAAG